MRVARSDSARIRIGVRNRVRSNGVASLFPSRSYLVRSPCILGAFSPSSFACAAKYREYRRAAFGRRTASEQPRHRGRIGIKNGDTIETDFSRYGFDIRVA